MLNLAKRVSIGAVASTSQRRAQMANAETLRVVDPLEYNRAFLTKGVRPDGRALLRGRKAVPHGSPITSAEGSALLRLGETAVLVGVQCEPTAAIP